MPRSTASSRRRRTASAEAGLSRKRAVLPTPLNLGRRQDPAVRRAFRRPVQTASHPAMINTRPSPTPQPIIASRQSKPSGATSTTRGGASRRPSPPRPAMPSRSSCARRSSMTPPAITAMVASRSVSERGAWATRTLAGAPTTKAATASARLTRMLDRDGTMATVGGRDREVTTGQTEPCPAESPTAHDGSRHTHRARRARIPGAPAAKKQQASPRCPYPCNSGAPAVLSRTRGALLLSRTQASVDSPGVRRSRRSHTLGRETALTRSAARLDNRHVRLNRVAGRPVVVGNTKRRVVRAAHRSGGAP